MKSGFLLDPSVTYLNHGSFGACPREVVAARRALEDELEGAPVEFLSRRSSALLDAALASLADYLGARAEDLAFVHNATMGVALAAASLPFGPGDEVLGSDMEYGACELIWRRTCASRGAAYRSFAVPFPWRGDEAFLAALDAAIGPRTKVLFLSHITSATACLLPVGKALSLARARGIAVAGDGAHVPGHLALSLDDLGADIYVGNCHKWLCAPKGSAFVHVAPHLHNCVVPPWASWGLVDEAYGTRLHEAYAGATPLARRLRWLGTRDPTPFLAVPAAIAFVRRETGPDEAARLSGLAASTTRRAAARLGLEAFDHGGAGLRMSLVPLPPGIDAPALKARLFDRHRIELPTTSHAGRCFLRLSFQHYNDEGDAERFLEALDLESRSSPP